MSDKIRPQDKWNKEHGYVSKSYKLLKNTSDLFAEACKNVGSSQAGVLTEFMQKYSYNAIRRTAIMQIKEKYKENDSNEKVMQILIDDVLERISNDDIDATICEIKKEIEMLGRNKKYNKIIENNYTFHCRMEFSEYLMLNETQSEFLQYVKNVYLREIACFYLMNENRLMPISLREISKTELNFMYTHGNKLFDLYIDSLPFDIFIIL